MKGKSLKRRCYHSLRKNWFTRRYISDIRHIYEILKPVGEDKIIQETMTLFCKGVFISITILIFSLSLKGTTIYNYIILFSVVFLLNSQIIQINLDKEEKKLLRQFEKYLGDVRHFYHRGGMVEDAIFDSLESAEYEITLHMGTIHRILVEDNAGEFEKYREIAPNKFFTTFLALCQITIQYGDTVKKEESLFLSNLNHLKNEVNIELLKRNKLGHIFSGLLFMAILPVFFLKIIENWSISNLPELEKYYYGGYGIIVSVIIFLATILSYNLISRLKGRSHIYERQHTILNWIANLPVVKEKIQIWIYKKASKAYEWDRLIRRSGEKITLPQLLIKRVILFCGTIFISIILLVQILWVSQSYTLYYTKDFSGTSFLTEESALEEARNIISTLSYELRKEKKEEVLREKIRDALVHTSQKQIAFSKSNQDILVKEIVKRVQTYQQYHFYWFYLILIVVVAYLISWTPLLVLECKRYFIRMSLEDEVIQFHSIIIMLMPIGRMNVHTILDWLENFSEIFKESLMECVDWFTYDEALALEALKEREPFLPFVRIIENLEACDCVGVEKAFDEILGQRSYYMEKRKQENEIMISNKGVIGRVIAYIPLALTLGLYLIVPFVLESITQLMGYMTELSIS